MREAKRRKAMKEFLNGLSVGRQALLTNAVVMMIMYALSVIVYMISGKIEISFFIAAVAAVAVASAAAVAVASAAVASAVAAVALVASAAVAAPAFAVLALVAAPVAVALAAVALALVAAVALAIEEKIKISFWKLFLAHLVQYSLFFFIFHYAPYASFGAIGIYLLIIAGIVLEPRVIIYIKSHPPKMKKNKIDSGAYRSTSIEVVKSLLYARIYQKVCS